MSIETAALRTDTWEDSGQPYPYRRVELVEPDWTRFPGWTRRHRRRVGVGAVAARALRQERRASCAS